MYQIWIPIGVVGVFIYYNKKWKIQKQYSGQCLYDGTFDDFYIVDNDDKI